ncbi:MAG: hypothetical protein GY940_48270, partial [bacterium]|nr:hypothetical protein [bacterium]
MVRLKKNLTPFLIFICLFSFLWVSGFSQALEAMETEEPQKTWEQMEKECEGIKNADTPLKIMSRYQVPNKTGNVVVPYIVNLMALDMITGGNTRVDKKRLNMVKEYIHWYLCNANYPDRFSYTGTMYDYVIAPGGEPQSLKSSASIDSYAGTFILLLGQYVHASGDEALAREHKQRIRDIAYMILFSQGTDGLTRVFPNRDDSYLMNNCMAYAGAAAMVELSRRLKWEKNQTFYQDVKEGLSNSILAYLYDPARKLFYWAIEDSHKRSSRMERFYPDAYAQLFPVVFDLLWDNKRLRKSIWKQFRRL